MSNDANPMGVVSAGLGKGCLAGLGLAVGFFAISGLVYLLLGPFGLERNIRLLLTIVSGPILGTLAVVVIFLQRSARARRVAERGADEPASRDAP